MTRPELVSADHPALRQRAAAVTKGAGGIAAVLWQTLCRRPGVGLAAPQIGISKRVAVMNTERHPRLVIVNPRLISHSLDQFESVEGCLSLPGVTVKVPRWYSVFIEATDENRRLWRQHFIGFHATVVQHEMDHLDGILITDRAPASVTP